MKIIGLTGGIATGKSTVSQLIKKQGFPVIDADVIAREIVAPGSPVLADIAEAFGPQVLTEEGDLNRARLAAQVFGDPAKLKRLNAMTHPAILAKIQMAIRALEKEGIRVVFLEVPLLFESGMDKLCEAVIVVTASPEIQLERLQYRDGLREEDGRKRLAAQWKEEKKRALGDYVLDNSGHIIDTESRLREILKRLETLNP